jgi:SHS2 domain-containing protein
MPRAHEAMIRMLDHTADVGFELAEAPRLEDLFDEARQALLMTVFEKPPERGEYEDSVRLSASDLETLLVRWINELIFFIQGNDFVPANADLWIQESGEEGCFLEAHLTGTPVDLERYSWQGEIKSATFHGLEVTRESLGWRAQVILDV